MSDRSKKQTPGGNDRAQFIVSLLLVGVGAFLLLISVLTLKNGGIPESGGGAAVVARATLGTFGMVPGLLAGLAILAAGCWIFLTEEQDGVWKHLAGALCTAFALSILLGALSLEAGGTFGALSGGAVSGIATKAGGALFGVLCLAAPVWLFWLKDRVDLSRFANSAPRSSADAELEDAGVSALEAEALAPPTSAGQAAPELTNPYPEDVRLRGAVPEGATPLDMGGSATATFFDDAPVDAPDTAHDPALHRWTPERHADDESADEDLAASGRVGASWERADEDDVDLADDDDAGTDDAAAADDEQDDAAALAVEVEDYEDELGEPQPLELADDPDDPFAEHRYEAERDADADEATAALEDDATDAVESEDEPAAAATAIAYQPPRPSWEEPFEEEVGEAVPLEVAEALETDVDEEPAVALANEDEGQADGDEAQADEDEARADEDESQADDDELVAEGADEEDVTSPVEAVSAALDDEEESDEDEYESEEDEEPADDEVYAEAEEDEDGEEYEEEDDDSEEEWEYEDEEESDDAEVYAEAEDGEDADDADDDSDEEWEYEEDEELEDAEVRAEADGEDDDEEEYDEEEYESEEEPEADEVYAEADEDEDGEEYEEEDDSEEEWEYEDEEEPEGAEVLAEADDDAEESEEDYDESEEDEAAEEEELEEVLATDADETAAEDAADEDSDEDSDEEDEDAIEADAEPEPVVAEVVADAAQDADEPEPAVASADDASAEEPAPAAATAAADHGEVQMDLFDEPDSGDSEPEVVLEPQAAPGDDARKVSTQMLVDAGNLFLQEGRVAVSMLQKRFALDFDQSCAILDELQDLGLIGPFVDGSRRDILLSSEEWLELTGPS